MPGENTELDQNTSDENISEQVTDQQSSEENGNNSGAESFTDVSFDDINRDELPENLQGAYDDLADRKQRMEAAYTQKTQGLSARSSAADNWQSIADDPELSRFMVNAINRRANGESLEQTAAESEPELPNAEEQPEEYLAALIGGIVRKELGAQLPALQTEISNVSSHVRNQQASLEFDNLVSKYPAAKAIGSDRLNSIRSKAGNAISLEQAFGIASLEQPEVLFSNDSNRTPSGKKTGTKTQTRVEQPQSGKTGNDILDVPENIKSLYKAAKDLQKSGGESILNSAKRSLAKTLQRGEVT